MKKSLLFFALVLASYGTIQAQVTTSSMTGVVTESAGQATVGATIKATHMPSGTAYSGSANSAGRFNLANMRVGGPYRVEVTYVGQNPIVYEDVYLQLGQAFVLNPIFGDVANALEEVTVTGSRIKSEKNGTATVVGRSQIENLPSINRSINDLTRLTPQANGTAIGGGNYRANNFTVDGANFNNQFGIGQNMPANGSPISVDAIEQIVVNVTPFDVRQSGFTGAAVNAVTRSGRNEFFGSAFYTGRSDQQQGTRVKDKQVAFNEMNEKQYGFSLGGPIIKNKLFFFVNLEQNKTTEPGPTKIADDRDARQYGQGNTNIARPTYQFLDDVRNYLTNTYGYDPGAYQGYSNKSNNDKIFAKIDWNIADNHKVNFRYNQVKGKSPSNISNSFTGSGISNLSRTGSNALHFGNSNYFSETNLYSGVAEYNGKWGNTNNTVRIAYVNQNEPRSIAGSDFPLVDIKDGDNIITTFGYEPFSYGNLRDVETITAYWDGNYTLGKHDFTYGAQYETSITKNGFQRFGAGYYLFNSWDDFVNGNKPANYVLTYPLTEDGSQAFPSFRFDQYSFFLQDQYTVNSKLKFMGGIRFELPTYPNVDEMKTHPLVADLTFANGLKLNTGAMPKSQLLISPRIGFNYDAMGDRSLIFRGGTGIFTGRIPFVWIVAQSSDAGMLQATKIFQPSEMPDFSPDIKANYPATLPQPGTFIPTTISAMDEKLKFPSTWKSSLAVDYSLPWGIQATVEGIYNKDINAVVAKNVNLVDPTQLNISGYNDHRYIYPSAAKDKYINKLTTGGVVESTAVGRFDPTYMTNAKGGHYYSVTVQLQKNNWNGFSGSLAYTHSGAKNFGDGAGDQIANLWSIPPTNTGNPNDPSLGFTTNVVPHRLMGFVSYKNNWIGKLNTSMTVFYSGSSTGRMSYVYGGDFNRDNNSNNNDLIYVPNDPSEITFVNIAASQAGSGKNYAKAYTAEEQSDMFFKMIDEDDYLRSRKGKHVDRNGGVMPWRNQFDFRLSQEIVRDIAGGKNALEFYWDVFNIGNLFNSNWGVYKSSNTQLLRPQNTGSLTPDGTTKPTFQIGYNNGDAIKSTTYVNESITSTYYMQFGVKFSFN
ncbi:Carboxypeptidase regulatory-like domain-containing protein [Sphingobacterium nematocida]|uniref:Carboxypeptidase regulatory-like domain-containing protein n=1 Tax=Sphingobacterium nematocida TaxID=1513896 RepID=A0A1T5F3Y4_9SPHI|nr:carboxypeptidase regulatory-like domain-containing protein [Sphingobacterium nematocida]SKB90927.1 Carboxypeptidase regulatory-like domain-containing protein [Sphingobacterium nematocida]